MWSSEGLPSGSHTVSKVHKGLTSRALIVTAGDFIALFVRMLAGPGPASSTESFHLTCDGVSNQYVIAYRFSNIVLEYLKVPRPYQ